MGRRRRRPNAHCIVGQKEAWIMAFDTKAALRHLLRSFFEKKANYFMMQQGGVVSITKSSAYLVRITAGTSTLNATLNAS